MILAMDQYIQILVGISKLKGFVVSNYGLLTMEFGLRLNPFWLCQNNHNEFLEVLAHKSVRSFGNGNSRPYSKEKSSHT